MRQIRLPGGGAAARAGQGPAPPPQVRSGWAARSRARPCRAAPGGSSQLPYSRRRAASRERRARQGSPQGRARPLARRPPPCLLGAALSARSRAGTAPAVGRGALGRGGGAGAHRLGLPGRADSAAAPAPCPRPAGRAGARSRRPGGARPFPRVSRLPPRRARREHGRAVPHPRHLRRLRGRGGSRLLPHLFPAAAAAGGVQERTVSKPSWYCSRGYSAYRVKSVV